MKPHRRPSILGKGIQVASVGNGRISDKVPIKNDPF